MAIQEIIRTSCRKVPSGRAATLYGRTIVRRGEFKDEVEDRGSTSFPARSSKLRKLFSRYLAAGEPITRILRNISPRLFYGRFEFNIRRGGRPAT